MQLQSETPQQSGCTENNTNMNITLLPPNNEIWYTSSDGKIVTPTHSSVFGVEIVSNTYNNGKGVIVFDGAVTEIGEDAFYHSVGAIRMLQTMIGVMSGDKSPNWMNTAISSSNITSIAIPNSVTKIGGGAFSGCQGLTSITIPNSVTDIGHNVFMCCNSLMEFKGKFASADGRSLIIGEKIIAYAPAGMSEYAIPDNVTEIGDYVFKECHSLKKVSIPNSVTKIGKMAFCDCDNLESICIPDSVTEIGEQAFSGCKGFTSVNIPNSVKKIGNFAFSDCDSLTCVDISNNLTEICLFAHCKSLTSVNIPNSVIKIGDRAFMHCSSLTSVEIPDGVTTIGHLAFWDCANLRSITIPDSVKKIDKEAFKGCKNLPFKTKLKILKIRIGL